MTTRLSARRRLDGSEIWTSVSPETGQSILYLYRPLSSLQVGDRLESVRTFSRTGGGPLVVQTRAALGVVTPQVLAELSADAQPGQMLLIREATSQEASEP